jgi:hypothetical protein
MGVDEKQAMECNCSEADSTPDKGTSRCAPSEQEAMGIEACDCQTVDHSKSD